MKEVWVLTEITDLACGGEWDYQNYRSGVRVFQTFETAVAAMRERIVSLGKEVRDSIQSYYNFDESEEMNDLLRLYEAFTKDPSSVPEDLLIELTDKFGINNVNDDFEKHGWTDYMLGFGVKGGKFPELICHGYDDGPCNGINPYIYINCFNMSDPDKKYCFHVEDCFSESLNFNSHVFLELEKVSVEE